MKYPKIESRLKEILADTLGVKADSIAPSARFDADLGADPLDCVEIIMTCEGEWDIHITEDEAESAYTFSKLAALVNDKLNGKLNGVSNL